MEVHLVGEGPELRTLMEILRENIRRHTNIRLYEHQVGTLEFDRFENVIKRAVRNKNDLAIFQVFIIVLDHRKLFTEKTLLDVPLKVYYSLKIDTLSLIASIRRASEAIFRQMNKGMIVFFTPPTSDLTFSPEIKCHLGIR